jgi:protein TonB
MQSPYPDSLRERLRGTLRRRGAGVVLALLVECLILFLFLTFVSGLKPKEKPKVVTFGLESDSGDVDEAKTKAREKVRAKGGASKPQPQSQPVPVPITPPVPPEAKSPAPVIWMTRQQYRSTDLAGKQGTAQPSDTGSGDSSAPDSALAQGRGPHGEPLYAAEWYREPTDAQLSPYIPERARGRSGWGVVACRTVANYRVEDCQELDDSPRGSGYAGAVRQAAFQFRVRPPRVGGKYQVGAWVRILITYRLTEVPAGDSARPGPQSGDQ